jgi:lysophospholipase
MVSFLNLQLLILFLKLAAVLSLFSCQSLYAISELNFKKQYEDKVVPFFNQGLQGSFIGKAGIAINYRTFVVPEEKAKLVILPGRLEPLIKYSELIYDLKDLNYSVYILDHRGQGQSGRILKDPQIQYVDDYDDYVQDLGTFIDTVVQPKSNSKLFMLAHSMGGAIGALYLKKFPYDFKAVVLSSPMFEINTHQFPYLFAYGICTAACAFGKCASYALEQKGYEFGNSSPLGQVTLSLARHQMNEKIFIEHPETQMGGVSYKWLLESFKAMDNIAKMKQPLEVPILLLQAGEDFLTRPTGQDDFCKLHNKCQKIKLERSRHEILMERDFIRDLSVKKIKEFYLQQE